MRTASANTSARMILSALWIMFGAVRPAWPLASMVDEWYRAQLKAVVPSLITKWESLMGVTVQRFFVQKMKTKWGSCNARAKSIRLNTELTKKPPECLEYILVHELVHLLARRHDEHFTSLMDRYLPNWRFIRQTLNEAPLAHADWAY